MKADITRATFRSAKHFHSVVMQQGRVIEEGNHDSLAQRSDGLYARLNNLQRPAASDAR